MCQESVYARFQRNLRAIRAAEARVTRLVERFVSVAERLGEWEEVGFEGTLGEVTMGSGAVVRIRFQEVPSLGEIYRAKQAWADARMELRDVIGFMRKEERDEILSLYPELRDLA